jgi:DNA-binding FrmR family transcriptional regulator
MTRPSRKKIAPAQQYLTPEAQKSLADRLARAEGHLRSIRQMVIDHRCADEVLIQIAAVKAALNQTAAALIDSEMRACADTCMGGSVEDRLGRVTKALSAVLKSS